jgi:hypothetical protein
MSDFLNLNKCGNHWPAARVTAAGGPPSCVHDPSALTALIHSPPLMVPKARQMFPSIGGPIHDAGSAASFQTLEPTGRPFE